jgi:hypothetical protein
MKNDQRSREDKTATKQQPMPRSRLGEPALGGQAIPGCALILL